MERAQIVRHQAIIKGDSGSITAPLPQKTGARCLSPIGYPPTDGHQRDSILERKAPSDINSGRQSLDDMITSYDPLPVFRSIVKKTTRGYKLNPIDPTVWRAGCIGRVRQ